MAAEEGQTGRRLLACNVGCLGPKIDPTAVASSSTFISLTFSAPYAAYSSVSSGYAMSFGICSALNGGNFTATAAPYYGNGACNYRNVTVSYVTGDTMGKLSFVYNVTFYQLPANAALLANQTAALAAALPSSNTSAVGSVAYGMFATMGGALSTLTGVTLGYGLFAPPPSQPPPQPPPPPTPPMSRPPNASGVGRPPSVMSPLGSVTW